MSFKTILGDVENGFKKFFSKSAPVLEEGVKVAEAIEPFVDVLFPGYSVLYNATVGEVAKAEALAIAAGQQTGTGPQKLATAVAGITPTVLAYAAANKLPVPNTGQIVALVNGVVASLNALSSATAA